jgi:hypothetical protein
MRFSSKRVARADLNLSHSSGIDSLRRRRWPMGYSTSMRSVLLPSVKKIWMALAMERCLGVEIILAVARVFDDLHLEAQRVDARIGGLLVLVVLGGQRAVDERDGDHVLDAVIAVGGVIQRAGLVDDADGGFLASR